MKFVNHTPPSESTLLCLPAQRSTVPPLQGSLTCHQRAGEDQDSHSHVIARSKKIPATPVPSGFAPRRSHVCRNRRVWRDYNSPCRTAKARGNLGRSSSVGGEGLSRASSRHGRCRYRICAQGPCTVASHAVAKSIDGEEHEQRPATSTTVPHTFFFFFLTIQIFNSREIWSQTLNERDEQTTSLILLLQRFCNLLL